jgi:hypothetical protein
MNDTALLELLKGLVTKSSFVGVTYTSKKHGDTSRYVLRVNTSYKNFLEKRILEAELRLKEEKDTIAFMALAEMKLSFEKSLEYHLKGEQNPDYTKIGLYEHLSNGVQVNKNDNTLELAGVQHSRVTLIPGEYKEVKHRTPITAKKAELGRTFEQWKTLSIDLDNFHSARLNGETVEIE